jgi:predicted nucleic acid-binding protein
MNYIDTDVLIHSIINQNLNLHLKINDLIEEMANNDTFLISLLTIQEAGFVLAKLDQPVSFITSKMRVLLNSMPVQYGNIEFNRALELAEIIGFKDFNDCLHIAIAEQHCTDLFTCNYKDFKKIQPLTSVKIHFL